MPKLVTRPKRAKRGTKRKRSIEDRLIASAREAVAIAKGRTAPGQSYVLPRTARDAAVPPPKTYRGADVIRVRQQLGLSQAVFASAIGKSAPTVRSWEQGQRLPDPAANRMLEIAERHPSVILELVGAR